MIHRLVSDTNITQRPMKLATNGTAEYRVQSAHMRYASVEKHKMATCGGQENVQPVAQNVCQVYEESQARPVAQPPRGTSERGGYECEFVQRPPDIFQTECSVCLQVLKEPHIISCCGHSFCKSCIKRVEKDDKSCPLCNEEEFTLMHNKGLERSLKELEVYCTHCKIGCEWIGKLGVLDQHFNINPAPEKRLEGCGFIVLKCDHVDCGQFFQRCDLANHQAECPKRPFSCDYCREYESTFEDVVNNHYPVCKCYPLSCPNNCAPDTIASQDLQRHLDEDCPLQVVHCDFQYAGCKAKLPRKDMPAHLAESYTHITLLAVLNQRLAQKNDEMAAKLLEKEEQIERLTEEFRNEMEIKQTEVDELKLEIHVQNTQHQLLRNEVDQLKKDAVSKPDFDKLKKDSVSKLDLEKLKKDSVAKTDFNKLKEEVQFKKGAVHKSEFDKLKRDTISHTEFDMLKRDTISHAEFDMLKRDAISHTEFDMLKRDAISHAQLTEKVQTLHHHIHISPVQIVMTNFEQHRMASTDWYSEPFYTHPHGYKMCLRVDANGCGSGEGTHVSMFIYMMRGEFDDHLEWPFQGRITVQLLNHLDDEEHHTELMKFTPDMEEMNRVTDGERTRGGRGLHLFIAHKELNYVPSKNRQYLKNNCLMFLVAFEP